MGDFKDHGRGRLMSLRNLLLGQVVRASFEKGEAPRLASTCMGALQSIVRRCERK